MQASVTNSAQAVSCLVSHLHDYSTLNYVSVTNSSYGRSLHYLHVLALAVGHHQVHCVPSSVENWPNLNQNNTLVQICVLCPLPAELAVFKLWYWNSLVPKNTCMHSVFVSADSTVDYFKHVPGQCNACRYWSFATLTTVGYGDFFPQHQKILFSFFFLVCVTVFGTVLAEIAGIVLDLGRFGRWEKLLKKGFSKELMDVLDTNRDGRVRVEYPCFV